jgi:lysophosphatidylglycerol acyltransferase 1
VLKITSINFWNPQKSKLYTLPLRYATKNNLPILHHVTLPRIGAMKTIIDVLGPGQDEDPAASTTPPQSMKDINKVINGDADEFYIDNEYTNQQSPPTTPLRNAYNANNHNNNKPVTRIIGDDENLKEKIGEAEISAKKTIKYVLDITIAYADGKPLDLPNIVTGLRRSCQTHLLYRLYRCSEVS